MKKIYIDAQKSNAIFEEIDASFKFILVALQTLKDQQSPISNNHVPLQLLAAGFERILKILLLIKDKHIIGCFPELSKAKSKFQKYSNGHGIEKMLKEMIEYSETQDIFEKIPMLRDDLDFLKNDIYFKSFIQIITEFSIQQRYYYIDTLVLGHENNSFNPFEEFKKLIWSFEENIDVSKHNYNEEDKIKLIDTIICIEKGTRAISRFFTHGFGDTGKQYYYDFSNFLLLKDKDLGKLAYTVKKIAPADLYKPISVYSLTYVRIKSKSKFKMLKSIDFEHWPFKVNNITVFSHKDNFYFAEINNKIYALTGRTCTRFEIPLYFKSDKLKPREVAPYILDEAKSL